MTNKMRKEISRVIALQKFFHSLDKSDSAVTYSLKTPSKLLLQNINTQWLKSLLNKTQKQFPVFVNKCYSEKSQPPFGQICHIPNIKSLETVQFGVENFELNKTSVLQFDLMVPQKDDMQYFLNWQRYRKYWWSSISTTPSLFSLNNIDEESENKVNIVAKFPTSEEVAETVTINTTELNTQISCTINLENAMFILLLDALTNSTKEKYLKLHRKMAPYKIAFTLNSTDVKNKLILLELAKLLSQRLKSIQISTFFPDFNQELRSQIEDSLQIGVVYTAILNESTLSNGIFQLLSSSTMLKEQVHVADFDSYASVIVKS